MSLLDQARADLQMILEDPEGFSQPVTVTSPAGDDFELIGKRQDIALTIDPDTGVAVKGRQVSLALSLRTIADAGMERPVGIADSGSRPWVVTMADSGGNPDTFKVVESNPDDTIGVVTLLLEAYRSLEDS